MSAIQVLVGLANPGPEYADTRHNAGSWFIEAIARNAHVKLRFDAKYHGLYALAHIDHVTCHLLIPTTFMNASGKAVRALLNYHKLSSDNLLVAHDEIDLPVATIRLKLDGGDGGHNGLKDIIRHLHTKTFYRLRIGVGRPSHGDVVDYVLHPPSKADRQKIDLGIDEVLTQLPLLLDGQTDKVMQKIHTMLKSPPQQDKI